MMPSPPKYDQGRKLWHDKITAMLRMRWNTRLVPDGPYQAITQSTCAIAIHAGFVDHTGIHSWMMRERKNAAPKPHGHIAARHIERDAR